MKVVAFVPDLMDRSRFGAVDAEVTFVSGPAQLVEAAAGADVVVLDLGRPGVLEVVPELGDLRTIGFLSHIDGEGRKAALIAGVQEVFPRSRFFPRIVAILSQVEH